MFSFKVSLFYNRSIYKKRPCQMVEMGCKHIEKRTCPSVAYRGMRKVNSEDKIFAYDSHSA